MTGFDETVPPDDDPDRDENSSSADPEFVNDEPGGTAAEPLIDEGMGEDSGALTDEDDPVPEARPTGSDSDP